MAASAITINEIWNKNKKHTEATREKISLAIKEYWRRRKENEVFKYSRYLHKNGGEARPYPFAQRSVCRCYSSRGIVTHLALDIIS